jgi:redox-sensitive bicupin YhaK (pirin superfamily)
MSVCLLFPYTHFLICLTSGFGAHPHRDMEICTYIVNGFLTHKDSMGTEETLSRGDIQFMV